MQESVLVLEPDGLVPEPPRTRALAEAWREEERRADVDDPARLAEKRVVANLMSRLARGNRLMERPRKRFARHREHDRLVSPRRDKLGSTVHIPEVRRAQLALFKNIRTGLFPTDDWHDVTPRGGVPQEVADNHQMLLRHQFGLQNFKQRFSERALKQGAVFGTILVEVYFERIEQLVREQRIIENPETVEGMETGVVEEQAVETRRRRLIRAWPNWDVIDLMQC